MTIPSFIARLSQYYRRHGIWATCQRAGLALRRSLFSNRMALFYCDLAAQASCPPDFPQSLTVERKRSRAELTAQDFDRIVSAWNPKLAERNMEDRFRQGASLWLIKSEDRLAGYGWTLQGRTIEPHYLPLGNEDVHFFDFQVFPQFRGRGMNPLLVSHILRSLATEGRGRAFIEAAQWNHPQLASLNKMPFICFGRARKWTMFGHTIVAWARTETPRQGQAAVVPESVRPAG